MPIPPASASAIAILDSVTVSMAAEIKGIFSEMFLESFDSVFVSLGRKSL